MKTLLKIAAMTLGCLTVPAYAAAVDFEGQPLGVGTCGAGVKSIGGLNFASSGISCTLGPSDFANWPAAPASTILVNGYAPLVVTSTGGGIFALASFDAQNGTYNTNLGGSDTIQLIGNLFGGGTVTANLTINDPMATYALNWTSLTSVSIGSATGGGYTGFDNFSFTRSAAVPEPATWAMMLLGFGVVGGAMRRRQKVNVSFA